MKTPFKLLALMLITSVMLNAQQHKIHSESFTTDKNTTAIFNLDNITVALEESTDGKVHVDYIMEFDGYSKKEINSFLDEVKVEVGKFDNHITLSASSKNKISMETFEFNTTDAITLNKSFFDSKKDTVGRKSLDALRLEIEQNNHSIQGNSLKYINDRFKKVDKDGKVTNFKKGGIKMMRSHFTIKIPSYLKLTVNAKETGVYARHNLRNELSITLNGGTVKTKLISNPYNKFKIENATLEVIGIVGGDFEFKNVKNGKIGSIQNAKISSEFSKVEIGEIQKNTIITDFNSEYYFYNWAKDFKRFNLYSEYSKIHLFYPKLDYSFKVIGNNTKSFVDKYTIEMQPTKKGEKFNMMERKSQGNGEFSGEIFFNIIHGIIYSYNDSIKKINN
ncbi:hypothetical protein [Winogradskyella thalassocola]|uniref:Adhesin domain-containing protein n=1 Tax=Winogradskyella thalassocola TaxID=262004 RepID=A0A1G8H3X3_9FLAO|nr:hypothetical protein [Winogradskyella thalassocola]SDI01296.1 hypothetical protein SAMN04489796_106121 [Winogradskyella thalassocola]